MLPARKEASVSTGWVKRAAAQVVNLITFTLLLLSSLVLLLGLVHLLSLLVDFGLEVGHRLVVGLGHCSLMVAEHCHGSVGAVV